MRSAVRSLESQGRGGDNSRAMREQRGESSKGSEGGLSPVTGAMVKKAAAMAAKSLSLTLSSLRFASSFAIIE